MTNSTPHPLALRRNDPASRQIARRRRIDRAFGLAGAGAIAFSLLFLALFLGVIAANGFPAFRQAYIKLPVTFAGDVLSGHPNDQSDLRRANYNALVQRALEARFPDVSASDERRQLYRIVSKGASGVLRDFVMAYVTAYTSSWELTGQTHEIWLPASADADMLMKRRSRTLESGRLSAEQVEWIDALAASGSVRMRFNARFFTGADSREPELAGILSGLTGSLFVILICLLAAMPVGICAAVYLEEFAPRNRFADALEVSINNLAAVPSIVYGLLALAVFINFLGLPRGSALAGGLALALLILPTLIIAARHALSSVPSSLRDAATAMGASPVQTLLHHTLPLATPGIMTGTILGIARALGETAPLLMIGMVAFVADVPRGLLDPAAALPVQIYLWADSPEAGFAEKTSAAILMLLGLLALLNASAVYLRRKFEYKW